MDQSHIHLVVENIDKTAGPMHYVEKSNRRLAKARMQNINLRSEGGVKSDEEKNG